MSEPSDEVASQHHTPNQASVPSTPNSDQRAIYRQFARGYDEGAPKHVPEWRGNERMCSACGVKLTNKNSYRNCKGGVQ